MLCVCMYVYNMRFLWLQGHNMTWFLIDICCVPFSYIEIDSQRDCYMWLGGEHKENYTCVHTCTCIYHVHSMLVVKGNASNSPRKTPGWSMPTKPFRKGLDGPLYYSSCDAVCYQVSGSTLVHVPAIYTYMCTCMCTCSML